MIVAPAPTAAGPRSLGVVTAVGSRDASPTPLLQSLADRAIGAEVEVVLVDLDGSLSVPAGAAPVRVVRCAGLDVHEALHLGVLAARTTHVLTQLVPQPVDSDAVGRAVSAASRSPRAALVAPYDGAGDGDGDGGGDGEADVETWWQLLARTDSWLVPTGSARGVRHDPSLGPLSPVATWLELLDQHGVELEVPSPSAVQHLPVLPDLSTAEPAQWVRLVAALQGMPRRDLLAQRLARRWVEESGSRLGALVASGGTSHRQLVDLVREAEVPRMPWGRVNRGRASQVALLYCFPPALDISGLVAARRLAELGHVTDVVTQDLGSLRGHDPDAVRVGAAWVGESRVLPGPASFDHWWAAREFALRGLETVERLLAEGRTYEQVYSRAMAVPGHVAGALVKLRHPGIRWVAEFSDPLLRNDMGETRGRLAPHDGLWEELTAGLARAGFGPLPERRFYELAELLPYALADEIIFTNQVQRDFMLGYCADRAAAQRAAGVARVSHHPQPAAELYAARRPAYPLEPGRLHIGYFGTFYRSRGIEELTGGVAGLTPAERSLVRVHVFTDKHQGVQAQVVRDGLADVVVVNPMRGFLEYLALTTRFDLLYVSDYATSGHYDQNPYLPAKIADYLGSGTPVWAVTEPGSVMDAMPVAWRSPRQDVAGATAVLRAALASRARGEAEPS